jgi:hypothetical protein
VIERVRDVERVNRLLARDFEGVDFSEVLAEPLHVCLVEGESGAIFAWRGPGIYELHLFFEVRGKAAMSLLRAMIARMFIEYGARLLWALVPADDRKVRLFARLMGWEHRGVVQTRNGLNELFVLEN